MQKLTIEQLKFAREIGATHYWKGTFWKSGSYNLAAKFVDGGWKDSPSWTDPNGASKSVWVKEKIDFSPLDEPSKDNDKEQPLEWPEERQDAIGQNGNDGEHYEKPETTHDVSHHKRKDGTDLIDEWWNKYEPEVARVLMWEMVNKYNNRLGKKDPVHIEVAKMADYMARWSEKEFELIK